MPFDSYIKPQLLTKTTKERMGCISLDSYIKPQRCPHWEHQRLSCISFDSYIKPQRTSLRPKPVQVVYLLIPTSNHDRRAMEHKQGWLYIFWFLHQTTTCRAPSLWRLSCISFDSYIKPRLFINIVIYRQVVYLLIPTSNHDYSRE